MEKLPRAPWRKNELILVAGALAVAALAAALASAGNLPKLQSLTGLLVILSIAYACSTDRSAIDRRTVAWGLGLQVVFALLVLKTAPGRELFAVLGRGVNWLLDFSNVGSAFVFGPLGDKTAWPRIMTRPKPSESAWKSSTNSPESSARAARGRRNSFTTGVHWAAAGAGQSA